MRYPYDNFPKGWSLTAGYGFGAPTSYGFHEAQDVNNLGGGNSDYGLPIYCIADGEVTSVHNHATNFGNHLHYYIVGPWGERWVHHAHCSEIFVKVGDKVKEGQLIAKIGNSGTQYAHDHWAIKKQPTGIDSIAKTRAELEMWEDPVKFVSKYLGNVIISPTDKPMNDQTIIDLGVHGKHEIQAIRGFYADAKNWKKDKDNANKANEELNTKVTQLQKINEHQAQMLAESDTDIKQLKQELTKATKDLKDCQKNTSSTPIEGSLLRQILDLLKKKFS